MAPNSVISLLVLILAIVAISAANNKMNMRCSKAGGTCIKAKNAGASCTELPYRCGANAVCCQGRKRKRKGPGGRQSCKTKKKCTKNGGTCIASSGECETTTIDKFCRSTCTCCLGDHPKCGASTACTSQDGFCIRKKKAAKYCSGGTTDDSLCTKNKCTCCLMDNEPATDSDCSCGQANTRIVGGEEVKPAYKYPWMVGMLTPFVTPGYACGATIINSRYVLTAAHCLYNPNKGKPMKPKQIKIGIADHQQLSTDEDIAGVTEFVEVESLIIHENYDFDAYPFDIGLLKLKVPLDLTANDEIKPVCLPSDASETYEGYDAIVAGWGLQDYDDASSYPDFLNEVTVPVLSPDCEGDLPSDIDITADMLCAGYTEGGKDACSGDSGGPLVVSENGAYTLIGIVSFGVDCAEPNVPGVYTRVTEYLDWIASNTQDGSYCSD